MWIDVQTFYMKQNLAHMDINMQAFCSDIVLNKMDRDIRHGNAIYLDVQTFLHETKSCIYDINMEVFCSDIVLNLIDRGSSQTWKYYLSLSMNHP